MPYTPFVETTGDWIGPYHLLTVLGEGGMGEVWLAEQTEPVKRRVALKVIKPGMDSKQVIARFEAERQALAMMDHPNIARVIDGGTTVSGSIKREPNRKQIAPASVKTTPSPAVHSIGSSGSSNTRPNARHSRVTNEK